jgi:hypothetical protein
MPARPNYLYEDLTQSVSFWKRFFLEELGQSAGYFQTTPLCKRSSPTNRPSSPGLLRR